MMNRNDPERRRLLAAGCLLISLAAALSIGAGDGDGSRAARPREEIEKMTPAQRARLDRNFELFQSMPPETQQRYRDLHRQIQADADAEGLRFARYQYRKWLKTLSPFQRKELKQIADPDQRLERVRELKLAQQRPAPLSEDEPRLSAEDMAAIVQVIADRLTIPAAKLEGQPDWRQHLIVLDALARRRRSRGWTPNWFSLFDEELTAAAIDGLPPGPFREAIVSVRQVRGVDRRLLIDNVAEFVRRELSQQLEKSAPTRADLAALEKQIENSQFRRQLDRMNRPQDRRRFLRQQYWRRQAGELLQEFPHLRPLISQLNALRGGARPPNRGIGPGRGERDGPRRGPGRGRRLPPGEPPPRARPGGERSGPGPREG